MILRTLSIQLQLQQQRQDIPLFFSSYFSCSCLELLSATRSNNSEQQQEIVNFLFVKLQNKKNSSNKNYTKMQPLFDNFIIQNGIILRFIGFWFSCVYRLKMTAIEHIFAKTANTMFEYFIVGRIRFVFVDFLRSFFTGVH